MRSFQLPSFFFFVLILFFFAGKSFSQFNHFDSVNVIASSPSYDYKNPNFEFTRNDLSQSSWLAYERYNAASSDIAVRKFSYSSYNEEMIITNTSGELNINPVVSANFLIWQSNKNGNWDIYYSIYNGSSWSAPAVISNTSSDEINPYIAYNSTSPIQYTAYYLVFERAGDIFLRKYRAQTSSWDSLEINLTDSTAENCSNPKLTGYTDFNVYFTREFSPLQYKVSSRRVKDLTASFQLYTPQNFEFILKDRNVSISKTWGDISYTFASGSPNSHIIGLNSSSGVSIDTFTRRLSGSHTDGKGSLMGIVTDNASSFYFSAFGCVTKSNDSSYINLLPNYYSGLINIEQKKKYVGSDTVKTSLDLSIPVSQANFYKIRAVWEQKVNGKTALVESYMVDFIGEVSSSDAAALYKLEQNYPNPFNPSTRINYELRITNYVSLKVFNSQGKEVATLVNEKQNAGSYAVDFNSAEFNLPSGIYFYVLSAGEFKETKKMVLVK